MSSSGQARGARAAASSMEYPFYTGYVGVSRTAVVERPFRGHPFEKAPRPSPTEAITQSASLWPFILALATLGGWIWPR